MPSTSPVYIPAPPLSQFVALLWYQESSPVIWPKERLLPTGTVELVIPLSDPKAPAVLCGPHSKPFFLQDPGSKTIIAAHFRPGGAFPFLGVAPRELHNRVIPLSDIWGSAAIDLQTHLLETGTLAGQFRVLERLLIERSTQPLERRPEVRYALKRFLTPCTSIASVTHQIGFSKRHFIDTFRREVGMTPKAYARVRRLQSVISTVGVGNHVDLGELALSCGFFDQSHFANDFKDLSGLTPSEYLALRTPHLNHVPVYE